MSREFTGRCPHLSECECGAVREDYCESGDVWNNLTHDRTCSRTYRWGKDGIVGLSDSRQRFCFALTPWSGSTLRSLSTNYENVQAAS